MKKAYMIKNVLNNQQLKNLQNYAMHMWANDKSTYSNSFGRHQWTVWGDNVPPNVKPLQNFHEMLLPLAKKEFESETLKPSWCLLSIYEGEKAQLWKHVDDNACTYHINLTVFQKTPWDFFVEGEAFSPSENDAVISYGNDQEHWRENFPNPETNLVCNAFFFYCEPDHWYFKEGPNYLFTHIRAKDNKETTSM
jgi:hypothetical protein